MYIRRRLPWVRLASLMASSRPLREVGLPSNGTRMRWYISNLRKQVEGRARSVWRLQLHKLAKDQCPDESHRAARVLAERTEVDVAQSFRRDERASLSQTVATSFKESAMNRDNK